MYAIVVAGTVVAQRDDITEAQIAQQYGDIAIAVEIDAPYIKPVYADGALSEGADIAVERARAKERVRTNAAMQLLLTDWKCLRHRDQIAAGGETSLTAAQYSTLLTSRQSIRDWSNAQDAIIDGMSDIADVAEYSPRYTEV